MNATRAFASLAVTMLLAAPIAAQPSTLTVRVTNPAPIQRTDETIAIAWSSIQGRLVAATATKVRVRDAATGAEITSQVLDADVDGKPDTLLFQANFFANEAKSFIVEAAAPTTPPKSRVHVKFIPDRTDLAWENDRMAFRQYGQLLWTLENLHSSGTDVWVKRTRELVLDKWYDAGHDAYHLDKGEGADFYKVGPTLGGGATAIWKNGKMWRAENFKNYRIIADGPIRGIFELDYETWDAGGMKVTERKRFAIDAGQNLYWQQSVFNAVGADSIEYAIGMVKRPGLVGTTSRARSFGWLTGWGQVDNKPGEGGHGDLGTAVLLDRNRIVDFKELDDHFIFVAKAKSGAPVVNYLGFGWTGSRDFRGVEDWWRYLDEAAQRLASPLRVTIAYVVQ